MSPPPLPQRMTMLPPLLPSTMAQPLLALLALQLTPLPQLPPSCCCFCF